VLHFLIGNDDLTSAARVVCDVPSSFAATAERIQLLLLQQDSQKLTDFVRQQLGDAG